MEKRILRCSHSRYYCSTSLSPRELHHKIKEVDLEIQFVTELRYEVPKTLFFELDLSCYTVKRTYIHVKMYLLTVNHFLVCHTG